MSSTSRNALYVLRLVLRGQPTSATPRRGVSSATATANLSRDFDPSQPSYPSSSSASPASTSTGKKHLENAYDNSTLSFLESESDEYETASLLLPTREFDPEPIPWPTLFKHPEIIPPKSKFCDPIYRLVTKDRYKDALIIYQEILSHNLRIQQKNHHNASLKSNEVDRSKAEEDNDQDLDNSLEFEHLHSIRIQHRHEYLKPVIHSLKIGDHKSVLLWLNIYPNRPATSNNPHLKKIWSPILDIFINDKGSFRNDPKFFEEFLVLIGKKGLLPVLLPTLLPHLTFSFKPENSKSILENSIKAYINSTTSYIRDSKTDRAELQLDIVNSQIKSWWSSYLRKLLIAGYKDEAKSLIDNKPFQPQWDQHTLKIIKEELECDLKAEDSEEFVKLTDTSTILKRIRLSLNELPTPTELSDLIRALSHPFISQDHPTLFDRYKSRFTRPPSIPKARKYATVQEKLWLHAEILNYRKEGNHQDAIDLFREKFVWAGLPDLRLLYPENQVPMTAAEETSKIYPSIQIITSIIPSLVYTLPRSDSKSISDNAQTFFNLYIESVDKFAPSLKPNETTYGMLLREITHHSGSLNGLRYLRKLSSSITEGTDKDTPIGENSYAAVLYALAGRRQIEQFWSLLSQCEKEESIVITSRTYRGLVAILIKTGLSKEAEKLFWRARHRFNNDDIFDNLDI
ncbi:uncharacterized protein L201_006890 [Kwoniella dendrophila CBS 6074]|uniref:ATPase expression protein 2, mitochondrial n=1 Tax=Kwoniella dendrophila CBS 6074 TaxID=1295534 RepID=A0AAX4K4B2_9TREE